MRLQGLVYTKFQSQCCNDASDTGLIEKMESLQNGVVSHFSSDSIGFNENRITSIIAELWRIDADSWCYMGPKTIQLLQNRLQTQFGSDSIVFDQSSIVGVFAALTLMLSVNGPLKCPWFRTWLSSHKTKRTKMTCHSCTLPVQWCIYSARYRSRLSLWVAWVTLNGGEGWY